MEISARDTLVIGDTAEDIACARNCGVEVLAMGTGCTSLETLKELKPDYWLESFQDLDKAMEILLARR